MHTQLDAFADEDQHDGGEPLRASRLSEADVRKIVDRALRGDGTLIDLMYTALFGSTEGRDGITWGDWPEHAVEAWDAATALFRDRHRVRDRVAEEAEALIRREVAWECLEAAVPFGRVFPSLAGVRNHEIPRPPDTGLRAFMRELIEKQHWTFAGRGRSRRVVLAPCLACGTVVRPKHLSGRLCPDCAAGA